MHSEKGIVFNIQRFSTSDGPGIRTVVFLKGCPLNCAWCHNPESKSALAEIFYKKEQCIGCKVCGSVCKRGSHIFEDEHIYNRENCVHCLECVKNCPAFALEKCGEEKSVAEVLETVLRDKQFYAESSGGITLSGGEPLWQYDFSLSLLKAAKQNGLHTAIETCGFTDRDLKEINLYTDLWLFDIKLFDSAEHKKYTGVSNEKILENLRFLDSAGAKIILRCPTIPQINDNQEHFFKIAQLANSLHRVTEINLEPYHPLGISKAEQLGKPQIYQNKEFLGSEKIIFLVDKLRARTYNKITIL